MRAVFSDYLSVSYDYDDRDIVKLFAKLHFLITIIIIYFSSNILFEKIWISLNINKLLQDRL